MDIETDVMRIPPAPSWIDSNAFRQICSWRVLSRSLAVAAIVGTILNVINQGPELMAGKHLNGFKLLLTYAVPFFVASYGAYSAFRHHARL